MFFCFSGEAFSDSTPECDDDEIVEAAEMETEAFFEDSPYELSFDRTETPFMVNLRSIKTIQEESEICFCQATVEVTNFANDEIDIFDIIYIVEAHEDGDFEIEIEISD
jgi:hypothetical protein